jgi:hypothetical protein
LFHDFSRNSPRVTMKTPWRSNKSFLRLFVQNLKHPLTFLLR